MPSPLQKVASGLLGALNLKTLGRNPQTFADELQPQYDATNHYLLDLLTRFGSTTPSAALGVGTTQVVTVPQGEVWAVFNIGAAITTTLAAGELVSFFVQRNLFVDMFGLRPVSATVTPEAVGVLMDYPAGISYPQPLMLDAGESIRVRNQFSLASATSSMRLNLTFARIPR